MAVNQGKMLCPASSLCTTYWVKEGTMVVHATRLIYAGVLIRVEIQIHTVFLPPYGCWLGGQMLSEVVEGPRFELPPQVHPLPPVHGCVHPPKRSLNSIFLGFYGGFIM